VFTTTGVFTRIGPAAVDVTTVGATAGTFVAFINGVLTTCAAALVRALLPGSTIPGALIAGSKVAVLLTKGIAIAGALTAGSAIAEA
jgi:hypothetical protein